MDKEFFKSRKKYVKDCTYKEHKEPKYFFFTFVQTPQPELSYRIRSIPPLKKNLFRYVPCFH